MNRFKVIVTTLSLAGGLASCPAAWANLITDGSFETPLVPPTSFTLYNQGTTIPGTSWSVVGASGSVAIVSGTFGFPKFPAQDGNQWLDLTGLSNTATGVQQTVVTTAATNYALSFYVGNIDDPGGVFGTTSKVNVSINGGPLQAFTNSSTQPSLMWQLFNLSFTATGPATTITFLNGDPANDNSNGLDNVSLVASPVPLPAGVWLLLSGLSGLGWLSLRRRTTLRAERH